MKVLSYKDTDYQSFVKGLNRRAVPEDSLKDTVSGIIEKIQSNGDQAPVSYTHLTLPTTSRV